MPTESRIYIIEGKEFTANSLAKELKCNTVSARNRLKKSKTQVISLKEEVPTQAGHRFSSAFSKKLL